MTYWALPSAGIFICFWKHQSSAKRTGDRGYIQQDVVRVRSRDTVIGGHWHIHRVLVRDISKASLRTTTSWLDWYSSFKLSTSYSSNSNIPERWLCSKKLELHYGADDFCMLQRHRLNNRFAKGFTSTGGLQKESALSELHNGHLKCPFFTLPHISPARLKFWKMYAPFAKGDKHL